MGYIVFGFPSRHFQLNLILIFESDNGLLIIFLRGHIKYNKVSILDKHYISQSIYSGTLIPKKNQMCAKQCFVLTYRSVLSGHSYYWTHGQDIHIAYIEDSSQTALSDMTSLGTRVLCYVLFCCGL